MKITLERLREIITEEVIKEELAPEIVREVIEGLELSDSELENMSDRELIDIAHQDGLEEFIVLDGEGDLANRDEVLAALKNV